MSSRRVFVLIVIMPGSRDFHELVQNWISTFILHAVSLFNQGNYPAHQQG